jgi:hypothetical protein
MGEDGKLFYVDRIKENNNTYLLYTKQFCTHNQTQIWFYKLINQL